MRLYNARLIVPQPQYINNHNRAKADVMTADDLKLLHDREQLLRRKIRACHEYYQDKAQRKCTKWNRQLAELEQERFSGSQ